MNKKTLVLAVGCFIIIGLSFVFMQKRIVLDGSGHDFLEQYWSAYKAVFISEDGRVIRPDHQDTVSEGQAYAMLWAVWMKDKAAFDRCYQWTERNLSRQEKHQDHLLAWHWKDGAVTDWMPASDADIDYALSLIFADRLWKGQAPVGAEDYGRKADSVLKNILEQLTVTDRYGRLYVLPWLKQAVDLFGDLPQNLSYYSPGHFRIFFEVSGDPRWIELVETTYQLLEEVSYGFNGSSGVGLVPDWMAVTQDGKIVPLEGRSGDFGWEAVRVPIRIAMDAVWFSSENANRWLTGDFTRFIERQFFLRSKIFAEYVYTGEPKHPAYESPLFYASYLTALRFGESPATDTVYKKLKSFKINFKRGFLFGDKDAYFENSLIWWFYALEYQQTWEDFLKG